MILAPGSHVGRYEILGRIGSGATGTVYRAQDPTIGRIIALKVIAAEPVAAAAASESAGQTGERLFKREAEAAGALTHPHIVTLYDAGQHTDSYYLAMELVDGETLGAEIARCGRLENERTIDVGTAVADALHFAHFRGVIHRDIKPANLISRRDGTVKVSDFGIARLAGLAVSQTTGQLFVGTPAYASPEAIRGQPIDGRADQFSLGIVLYLAATGRHPFAGQGIPATIYAILTNDPPEPRSVDERIPAELSAIIMRMLRREPNERFADCRAVADALRALRRPDGGEAETHDRVALALPRARSRRAVLVGGATVAAVAVATLAVLQWRRPDLLFGRSRRASGDGAAGDGGTAEAVTLGVVPFKGLAESSTNGWVRDALRDALNTELSQLSRVRVYSKEFLDFLVERKRLTEIEAMNELGIEKMLSGSVWAHQDRLHAEAFITDVSSGVLEGSVSAEGSMNDFAALRNRLVMLVIERLRLPISPSERDALEARQRVPVDPLRLLLESEGAAGGSETPADPPDRSSFLLNDLLARLGPAPALADDAFSADDAGAAREPILETLERYRSATEKGDFATLALVFTEFPPEQREAMERYLEVARDLQVSISDVELQVVGNDAIVSYTRTDAFTDGRSGRAVRLPVRLTKKLRYADGGWRIDPRGSAK